MAAASVWLLLRLLPFLPAALGEAPASPLSPPVPPAALFTDLSEDQLKPRTGTPELDGACSSSSIAECLLEYQTGNFDGSQQHRSLEVLNETKARLQPEHVRLLLLITTIWRNFERRHHLRRALELCYLLVDRAAQPVQWHFLLGDVPPELSARAAREVEEHDDLLLLGGEDEIRYSHIGDAYALAGPNPELTKIVLALRQLLRTVRFDFLLVLDDDSFVSLPNVLEILNHVPNELVYLGNMIDSAPQRFNETLGRVMPAYSVNIYLNSPAKAPIFAHGMGFLLSQDVARLLAAVGPKLKAKGNDDLLMGVWLRSIESLHYLHYFLWFADHEDFGGFFSTPCNPYLAVVHRMTPERWRRFRHWECTVCGPPAIVADDDRKEEESMDGLAGAAAQPGALEPGPVASSSSEDPACIRLEELRCRWPVNQARRVVASVGQAACAERCMKAAVVNGTLGPQRCSSLGLCTALCRTAAAPEEPGSRLCVGHTASWPPPPPHGAVAAAAAAAAVGAAPLRLAILVFGSAWTPADAALRRRLRAALRTCSSRAFGVSGVRYAFLMAALPRKDEGRRREAAEEVLEQGDVIVQASTGIRDSSRYYDYAKAWDIVEERFGGASHLLLMDHRSFVDVPFLVHVILPELPPRRVYAGSLLEPTLYGFGSQRNPYLMRRRAPMFAHGMGFIISSDVAQFVAEAERHVPLRRHDLPMDLAFGIWVQSLEDLWYHTYHMHFHMWPGQDTKGSKHDYPTRGDPLLSQPLTTSSALVFPMTPERWLQRFQPLTCSLRRG